MDKKIDELSLNDIKAIEDPKIQHKLLLYRQKYFRVRISPTIGRVNPKDLKIDDDTPLNEILRMAEELVQKKGKNK